ncbi:MULTISPECIES: putative peptidoglycan-binding domain-containing protein [unclassified Streptomyces]|uniref:glycoside hydrolase family 108 protein n=1 Tax=unclassified Streptomyces TaxID=2593676 RepID=UPI0024A7C821|nr:MULTISPECIES: putative peptidoglycan-binding domain-containing protein [unclassified Streptomyces]
MSAFDDAFESTVKLEAASGDNATAYGITEAVGRKEGYMGAMSELPLETAKKIYQDRYWRPLQLDHIAEVSQPVALKLFDTGVNMGIGTAAKFLQRSLNALNRQQADYPDMRVDGAIGPKTVAAFRAFIDKRKPQGETVLLKAISSLQGARYIEIAESREENEKYIFGWLATRV